MINEPDRWDEAMEKELGRMADEYEAAIATGDKAIKEARWKELQDWVANSPYGPNGSEAKKLLGQANVTAKQVYGKTFEEMSEDAGGEANHKT